NSRDGQHRPRPAACRLTPAEADLARPRGRPNPQVPRRRSARSRSRVAPRLDPVAPSYGRGRSGATTSVSLNRQPIEPFIWSSPMADADRLTLALSSGGNVVIKLRPDLAPGHVERITELANRGFYDNVVFHRVI